MINKHIKYLVCPVCGSNSLSIKKNKTYIPNKDNLNNIISCKKCESSFPVKYDIPFLINSSDNKSPEMSFDRQWWLKKKKFLEPKLSSGKLPAERYKKILNIFNLKSFPKGSKFLDAGCGNGINGLEVAKNNPDCLVFMTDVSIKGLLETREKSLDFKNVISLQSDLDNLIFQENFFDYVWCEGVLHHTPNTFNALKSLSNCVKKNGKIYIWLYPNYRKSYYLFIRDLFVCSHKLPFWAIYLLSVFTAIPYYFFNLIYINIKKIVIPSSRPYLKKRPFLSVVFSIYDSLNPKYQYRHSKKEAKGWLTDLGYASIKLVGDLGLVAKKK